VTEPRERRFEREQVVAALLEDADGLPRRREHIGRRRASRAGAHHDDVELSHR
jgi:hypothetical protein